MILHFVVEVDVGAARGVEAGKQFADDDEQFAVGGFFDKAAFEFGFVGAGRLARI